MVQFLTIAIVETTLFVFGYELKSKKNALEILNVLFLTLVIKKTWIIIKFFGLISI
jgi:hypothetical protein